MGDSLVVVTGAAGALGHSVASSFLNQGYALLLVDYNREALRRAYGPKAEDDFVVVDLTDTKATLAELGGALERKGPASILCNIAGGFTMGKLVHDADTSEWQRMMDMNVATTLNTCRAVVPRMVTAGKGKIINISAAAATSGKPLMGAYCASKSAVARITESMALELRDKGINVNAVAPSIIDTPVNRQSMPDADPSAWVSLQQLTDVIRFLASDQASAVHGAIIPVLGLS